MEKEPNLMQTFDLMQTFEAAYVIAMALKHRNNPNLETARQLHNAVDALLTLAPANTVHNFLGAENDG